jgi:hypothetical protein
MPRESEISELLAFTTVNLVAASHSKGTIASRMSNRIRDNVLPDRVSAS